MAQKYELMLIRRVHDVQIRMVDGKPKCILLIENDVTNNSTVSHHISSIKISISNVGNLLTHFKLNELQDIMYQDIRCHYNEKNSIISIAPLHMEAGEETFIPVKE